MRAAMLADLTTALRAAEETAQEYRDMVTMEQGWAADAAQYPQDWREQEQALLANVASYIEGELWAQHRECPSLLARIRDVTSGRMVRPTQDTRGDWRRYCPASYRRMENGMAADEVAEMLGFPSDDEMLSAIRHEAEDGILYTHAAAAQEARELAELDAQVQALRAQHMEEHAATLAEVEAAEKRADVYQQQADAQAALAATMRQALTLLLVAPAEAAPAARVRTMAALPTRTERKAVAARTLGETARALAEAAVAAVRQVARETAEGGAIAGGWMAEPVRALVAEARQAAAGVAHEARATLGLTGRHGRAAPMRLGGILAMAGVR